MVLCKKDELINIVEFSKDDRLGRGRARGRNLCDRGRGYFDKILKDQTNIV